jgi:hypothetical protein
LSASSLLREMAAMSYHGPVLVLEKEDVPVRRSRFPATVQVHVLRKPLEMQQVFRSVAEALSFWPPPGSAGRWPAQGVHPAFMRARSIIGHLALFTPA